MRAYICGSNNRLAHKLRKLYPMLSWGAAFRLALVASANSEASILHPHAVFGEWAPTSLRGVAGHFWGLSSAYAELDDRGRAYAMKALSRKLFAVHEAQCAFSFYNLAVLDNVAEGMLSEVVDYFTAALEGGHTPRTMRVIAAGAVVYGARVTPPVWSFE